MLRGLAMTGGVITSARLVLAGTIAVRSVLVPALALAAGRGFRVSSMS
jgi:hypothetical protein